MALSKLDEKQVDRLYDLLHRAEREGDQDTAAALRWAIFTLENPPIREMQPTPAILERRDYLTIWGYLQSLKDIQEGKARENATRQDEIGRNLIADYMKSAAEIRAMQTKIDDQVNHMGG